jgi:hypothetical protein
MPGLQTAAQKYSIKIANKFLKNWQSSNISEVKKSTFHSR